MAQMATRTLKIDDVVALTVGKPLLGLRKGQVGTVVEQVSDLEYRVHFMGLQGGDLKAVVVAADELLILYFEPGILRIRAARSVFNRRASWFFFMCAVLLTLIGLYMIHEQYGGLSTVFEGRYNPQIRQRYFGGETLLVTAVIFGGLSMTFRE